MGLRHSPLPLLLALAACGGGSPSAGPETDAGPHDAASPTDGAASSEAAAESDGTPSDSPSGDGDGSSEDGGAPCNTIPNDAPVIDVTQIAADPPTPQGGVIVDGTYWCTALDLYTGSTGPTGNTGTMQSTALIQGETVQLVSNGEPTRRTIVLVTSDAGFTSMDTCPETQMAQGGYTATPTTLTIFLPGGTDDAGARTVVETLTKQ
jgi:hypothetical protein